ncbi:ER degradation-enhancing alpha-mannosidase-like protein 3 [Asbolus verrucosus]|uniref:alpha-1,2-Mannosidase n=1 Tax=Asbolus verrucosus TaxID=1661398 RepID=A0A482V2S7_ASBVE|nr:ER degradation-enhancing alpha-mannosidase-like protein 3 [Asbolus verrucosus]
MVHLVFLRPSFMTIFCPPKLKKSFQVNMKYGMKSDRLESARETCTACAGSMILEMAALSRLTGEPIFEEKAHKAMDELWKMRHRSSDLMGTVLNVHSGDWVRRDSGVGAGIDSYYEYCLKAYILLGDNRYLHRFNRHYNAVMKYISQGPMLLDVHMHRPHTNSRNYMDALLAFWPGLQVLKGDIKPAVETHEMLYQVMQRHTFIPEAFTTDFQVHWGNHPLRPEFLESTYFLYGATNDPYYLEVGKTVLTSLQRYARVPCGYAAVNDVRTRKQEDRMDSFVLSETLKYLYLLFADKEDLILNLDEFIFTTEGHLLPLTLAGYNVTKTVSELEIDDSEFARTCPNTLQLFPETVRKPLQNMVDGMCPKRNSKRRLTATEFSASNINHLKMIKDMGINIIALSDGRVQLLHTFSSARSSADAEEGLLFMQEMMELSKLQTQQLDASPQSVTFTIKDATGTDQVLTVQAGPSQFGRNLQGDQKVTARTIIIHPFRACGDLVQGDAIKGKIAIMERGDCMFVDKARKVQKHGAVAAIIIDNTPGSSTATSPMFSMSGDGTDDVKIPTVFLFAQDASKLLFALSRDPTIEVTISEHKSDVDGWSQNEEESMFHKLKVSVQEFLNKHTGIAFSKSVQVGNFKANIGSDKIRITYEENDGDNQKVAPDTVTTPQWIQVRKDLLKSILSSESKELYVPLNILRIYYQTLSDDPMEDKRVQDTVKQAEWLLNQLSIEHHNKQDSLIKVEDNVKVLSILADFNQLTGKEGINLDKDDLAELEDKETLKALSSILESVAKDVKLKKEHLGNVMKKLKEPTNDDLVISDSGDNKDRDSSEIKNSDSEHIETKINHAVDEL